MWALRGLRNGVLTTRWPQRPDAYADGTRGPATVRAQPAAGHGPAADVAALCPAGAISTGDRGEVRLDQGSCILCGRCVAARPDVFGWTEGPNAAALSKAALVAPARAPKRWPP